MIPACCFFCLAYWATRTVSTRCNSLHLPLHISQLHHLSAQLLHQGISWGSTCSASCLGASNGEIWTACHCMWQQLFIFNSFRTVGRALAHHRCWCLCVLWSLREQHISLCSCLFGPSMHDCVCLFLELLRGFSDPLTQELYSQARAICSSEASPVHWALLTSDAWGRHESKYHTLLLSLWAVKCTIFDQLSLSDKEQIAFLLNNGIRASKSYSAQHLLLRPAKRRKSHKHKQQRKSHKRRNKSEGMRPSSGDESLSDGDLGIMTADADDNFIQTAAVWHLDAATHGLANLSAPIQDLPDVLLHLAIAQWIQHCCND